MADHPRARAPNGLPRRQKAAEWTFTLQDVAGTTASRSPGGTSCSTFAEVMQFQTCGAAIAEALASVEATDDNTVVVTLLTTALRGFTPYPVLQHSQGKSLNLR